MKIVHLFCIVLFALTFQAGKAERESYRSCSTHNDCDKIIDTVFNEEYWVQYSFETKAKTGQYRKNPRELIESSCAVDAQKNGRCRFVYKPREHEIILNLNDPQGMVFDKW